MNTSPIHTVAQQWVDGFDQAAHAAIGVWRTGTTRLGQAARERWDTAFAESSPQLSAESRRNAAHARAVFARYYSQGVALSLSGAEVAVDTMAQTARLALDRAAGWQQGRA